MQLYKLERKFYQSKSNQCLSINVWRMGMIEHTKEEEEESGSNHTPRQESIRHRRITRLDVSKLRWRPSKLRPHEFRIHVYSSFDTFALRRRSGGLDGLQPPTIESGRDGIDMARLVSPSPRCPSDVLLLSGVWIQPAKKVRDLGVIIDSDQSLDSHIRHVTSICYYHIRLLRLAKRSLEQDTAETLVLSFIHSRLDNWNGVLAG